MAQVFPTKANLIATKKSLELAKLGYDLMDRKRNILLKEMMAMIDEAKKVENEIDLSFARAFDALKKANLALGDVGKFANLMPTDKSVEVSSRSVMGVEIPIVSSEKSRIDVRFFGFQNTGSELDLVCIYFSEVKELTLKLCEIENSVCRLADAIKKTQKRSNALSNVMIPQLTETVKYITEVLDEKEREDFSRLKVIKKVK